MSAPSGEEHLRGERIAPILFKGLREVTQSFSEGCLVAVVYDLPLLAGQLDATGGGKGGSVLPEHVSNQHYAFAVKTGSELRGRLNRIIPGYTTSAEWGCKLQG